MNDKANKNFIFLHENVPHNRITLLQGGTRSGKTFSVLYYILNMCLKYSGLEIDICRSTYTATKATVWKDFETILMQTNLYDKKSHNKTDKNYILNNNVINYYGLDDAAKVHGRARDILFLNEAQHIDAEVIEQLFPRTRHRIICDFNPCLGVDHWLDEYLVKYPTLITTYKDNTHLTKSQIADIESRKESKYWWKVYGCGERASVEGVVFENWKIGEMSEDVDVKLFGLDFGFVQNATALVEVRINKKQKKIYVNEIAYSVGLTTQEIAAYCKTYCKDGLIIADSSDKRLIHELRTQYHLNIRPTEKFPHSIASGLFAMQDYEIIVTINSKNTIKELKNYRWHDKKANIAIDDYNDAIDAIRYAFMYFCEIKNIQIYVS